MARAVRSAADLGVWMVDVHAEWRQNDGRGEENSQALWKKMRRY